MNVRVLAVLALAQSAYNVAFGLALLLGLLNG